MDSAGQDRSGRDRSATLGPSARLSLVLRVTLEMAIVGALGYWGGWAADGLAASIAAAVAAPLVGFGFWGVVDFRHAGRLAEPLRLLQELAVSGLAAVALYATGRHVAGVSLGLLSIVYHAHVYATGARLLKPTPEQPARDKWPSAARSGP